MNKVLIVEDDEVLNAGLCFHLQKKDIEAEPAYSLEEARAYLSCRKADLILLDVNLPDGSGFKFASRELAGRGLPFVFLTGHSLDDEVIDGLRLGADDYITKPFQIRVVVEKILTLLRRCGDGGASVYTCGSLRVDFTNRTVEKSAQLLSLTPTEYELLEYFCKHPNQILTKEVLLEHIWDARGNYVNDHALTMNISRLRGKIEDDKRAYIKTVYGMGYQWIGGR